MSQTIFILPQIIMSSANINFSKNCIFNLPQNYMYDNTLPCFKPFLHQSAVLTPLLITLYFSFIHSMYYSDFVIKLTLKTRSAKYWKYLHLVHYLQKKCYMSNPDYALQLNVESPIQTLPEIKSIEVSERSFPKLPVDKQI